MQYDRDYFIILVIVHAAENFMNPTSEDYTNVSIRRPWKQVPYESLANFGHGGITITDNFGIFKILRGRSF